MHRAVTPSNMKLASWNTFSHFLFLVIRGCDGSETQWDKLTHREFKPAVELAVNTADPQNLRDLASRERDSFLEVIAECQDAESNEDIEILFGRQPEIVFSLDLRHHTD